MHENFLLACKLPTKLFSDSLAGPGRTDPDLQSAMLHNSRHYNIILTRTHTNDNGMQRMK
eukprot:scaffold109977_cov28-Attheya_sp.AAC.1